MLDNELSRRQLLVRSAATAAGLSLSLSILGAKKAHAAIDPAPNPTADNMQLNALLKAEYDAIATYTAGATIIAADATTDAGTKDTVTKVAVHFLGQHQDHANALKKLITDTGGMPTVQSMTPQIPAAFSAAAQTTTNVIKLAADKEKAAAFTYAVVMQSISTQVAAKLVAAIGAVETQHFIVLYLLAEGLITANAATNSMATLVVPASFILDGVGVAGTTSLSNSPALDAALALDPKPA